MMRCLRLGLAVTLLASAALCITAATPASNAAVAQQAAPAHPHMAPSPAAVAGSLHAAQKARSRTISAHNRAKAAEFVNHIENLISGLKHKAHLNRLQRKYNSTLNAQEDLEEEDEEEEILNSQEEHGGDPRFAQQQHAAATPAQAAAHIPAASGAAQRPTTTRHLRIPDEHHTYLDPVSPMEATDEAFSGSQYVLHPINVPSTAAQSSGLNFTTFVYPTIQGNVTIFVGVTEFPLGKFHFYPSPRDSADQDISLLKIQHRQAMEKANRAEMIRLRNERLHRGRSGLSSFLEMAAEVSSKLNALCDGVAETSVTAQSFGCLFAQNAGFFDMSTGACMGNVVSNDQLINRASAALQSHSHFGLTRKGNFITGYLTEDQVGGSGVVDGGYHELIQGSGWLIREGKQYINESMQIEGLGSGFVTEKAPRNAIGHDSQGRLVMFEADGEEDIQLGLTLYEFADILAHHFDVQNAINVDGGGSSTTVYENQVVDKPTCRDTPVLCERSVTTISCVMP